MLFSLLGQTLENSEEPLSIASLDLSGFKRPTRKRKGEIAELVFMFKAISLGFGVARPWGDSGRYDFILSYRTLMWRVQVKSTERFAESGYRIKGGGFTSDYRLDEIDFLVTYIIPEEVWYVVPVSAVVRHKCPRFYPHSGSKGRLEKYRDAWHLFKLPTLQTLEAMPHLL